MVVFSAACLFEVARPVTNKRIRCSVWWIALQSHFWHLWSRPPEYCYQIAHKLLRRTYWNFCRCQAISFLVPWTVVHIDELCVDFYRKSNTNFAYFENKVVPWGTPLKHSVWSRACAFNQRSLLRNSSILKPRLASSAGLIASGQCLHWRGKFSSLISVTLFAT